MTSDTDEESNKACTDKCKRKDDRRETHIQSEVEDMGVRGRRRKWWWTARTRYEGQDAWIGDYNHISLIRRVRVGGKRVQDG